jgi:hypothetical protein
MHFCHCIYVHKRNHWSVFELAVRLDDDDLCFDAVTKSSTWTNEEGASMRSEGGFGDAVAEGSLFDIRTYSLETMKALPIKVIWALSRASYSCVKLATEPLKKAHNELAQKYNKLMAMKGEFSVVV